MCNIFGLDRTRALPTEARGCKRTRQSPPLQMGLAARVDCAMSSARRCGNCKMPLGAGQYVTAASQTYHAACFVCSLCRKPISGSFVTAGNQPVCVQCSAASAPSCSGCGGKITEGGFVTVQGLSFHPQHFACATCGTSLKSGMGSSSNGVYIFESFGTKPRALCGSCHATASGRVCCGCSRPILGQHIVAEGRQFHSQCWTCAGCKRELAGMGFHKYLTSTHRCQWFSPLP